MTGKLAEIHLSQSGGLGVVGSNPAAPTIFCTFLMSRNAFALCRLPSRTELCKLHGLSSWWTSA